MTFINRIQKSTTPIQFFSECEEKNMIAIKQVMKNNRFFLKRIGATQKSQVEWFRKKGIIISEAGISRYTHGRYRKCSLSYLQFFALYWQIELSQLISRDFEMEDYLTNFR